MPRQRETESVTRTCRKCGKPGEHRVFCRTDGRIGARGDCRKCEALSQKKRKKQIKECHCGRQIKWGNKFCSSRCQHDWQWVQQKKAFVATGVIRDPRSARKFIIEKFGLKCSICEITEWMGKPVPVIADHKNGDPTDDRIKNRRLVCPNCDAQLPTFKSKNRGNGRAFRRARYAAGKSY